MLDPILELRNTSGALVASNDHWRGMQITASGLTPTDARESAIMATLPTGAYTVIVRGTGSSTGLALGEIYNLHQ